MKYLSIFFIIILNLFGQNIQVNLDQLNKLDAESVHLEILKNEAKENLILPENINPSKYLSLFYSWDTKNDEIISIVVIQNKKNDILYIDLNNDENLTNDGNPLIFSLTENMISFDIIDQIDPNQKTRLVLYRKPDLPDSLRHEFIDEEGNLIPKFAKMMGAMSDIMNYSGTKRSFYFDDKMGVRSGHINFDDSEIFVGLFDYTNNGIYTDDKDLLLIDFNHDKKLDYLHDEEIFKLNDIIQIQNKNYKLKNIDPYGKSFSLEETKEKPSNYFTRYEYEKKYSENKNKIDKEFWENKFTDINGKDFSIKKFKNRFVLLNFWGEWCLPCRNEIPEIVKASKKYRKKLTIVSFLKTNNIEKAKELMSQLKMDWVQIELNEYLEAKFKINGFPTNLLIFPDGETYLREGELKEDFFEKYIK